MLVQSPSASMCFSLAAGSGHRQTHPGALSLQRHPGARGCKLLARPLLLRDGALQTPPSPSRALLDTTPRALPNAPLLSLQSIIPLMKFLESELQYLNEHLVQENFKR